MAYDDEGYSTDKRAIDTAYDDEGYSTDKRVCLKMFEIFASSGLLIISVAHPE